MTINVIVKALIIPLTLDVRVNNMTRTEIPPSIGNHVSIATLSLQCLVSFFTTDRKSDSLRFPIYCYRTGTVSAGEGEDWDGLKRAGNPAGASASVLLEVFRRLEGIFLDVYGHHHSMPLSSGIDVIQIKHLRKAKQ